jgi:rod shape determining protein RodA
MIDRNLLANIDWTLIALLLLNSAFGVVFIYSCSHGSPGNYYLKQTLWIIFSLVALFLFLFIDYKVLVTYSIYLYFVIIFFLVAILIFGRFLRGAKRSWIVFPFFHAQPSEIAKIILILVLGYIFSEFKMSHLSWGKGILSSGAVVLPFFLVALQPDLGTAATYIPIFLAAIILAGLKRKTVIFLLIACLILGFLGWNFMLKDYQKKRLTTLIFPSQDPLGSSYHITQSKIAVGSGGLLGKGYKKGTQSQLRFLPARHTDFIFSVIGEEVGFLGVAFAIGFYFLFLLRLFKSVGQSRDRAGVYIVFMVAVMLTFQFMVNVMMVIGLFPITGIPLPLYSYGGSSLLANYLGISLVMNVKMRRFVNV